MLMSRGISQVISPFVFYDDSKQGNDGESHVSMAGPGISASIWSVFFLCCTNQDRELAFCALTLVVDAAFSGFTIDLLYMIGDLLQVQYDFQLASEDNPEESDAALGKHTRRLCAYA
jgi:hypothetical protein